MKSLMRSVPWLPLVLLLGLATGCGRDESGLMAPGVDDPPVDVSDPFYAPDDPSLDVDDLIPPEAIDDSPPVVYDEAEKSSPGAIIGRWPLASDRSPRFRRSPLDRVSDHVYDERPSWAYCVVENTGVWHWQGDFKIVDDARSRQIHGNTNHHRIQIGEPRITRSLGGWKLVLYMKHDRLGPNPIVKFTIYISNRRVTRIDAQNVRGAPAFTKYAVDLAQRGVNLVGDRLVSWASGGTFDLGGQLWNLLQVIFPSSWFHPYRGWEKDAAWFAAQVGYWYARELDP